MKVVKIMEFNRVKLTFSYDGTDFYGYQVQPGLRTVQAVLDETLTEIYDQDIRTTAAGRTDRGVHARGQVVHFDLAETPIPLEKLIMILKTKLPADIRALEADYVPANFHARYDAVRRTYKYYIDNQVYPDILRARYTYHVTEPLDLKAMQEAGQVFLGEHDFTSFCRARTDTEDKVRHIFDLAIDREGGEVGEIVITITANGFLYNMVRIIVAALVQVGLGRLTRDDLLGMLSGANRELCPYISPANGLVLWQVDYKTI